MENPDRLSSVFFIFLSAGVCLFSLELPRGTVGTPGPMIFPLLLGLSLLGLSLFLFARSAPSAPSSREMLFPRGETAKVVYVLTFFFLALLTLERLGFAISIFLLLALLLKVIGGKTIFQSILYGLIVSLAAYLSFQYLLGVRLPKGILNF